VVPIYAVHYLAGFPPATQIRERLAQYAGPCVVQVVDRREHRSRWHLVCRGKVSRLASGKFFCCVCGLAKIWPVDVVHHRHEEHIICLCRECGTEVPPVYELSPERELLLIRPHRMPAGENSLTPRISYFNVG